MTDREVTVEEGRPLRVNELDIAKLAIYLNEKKIRTTQGKLIQPLHQAHIEILSDPARYKVLAAGRRFGKSLITSLMALSVLMQLNRRVWIVAPTYDLTEKVFRELYNILVNQLKIIEPGKKGRARQQRGDYLLETPWGSVLEGKSLERPDSLAGEALDLVIVDEAALAVNIDQIWTQMLRPTLMDKEGSAIFISCLTKDTWINTDKGLQQISEYVVPEVGFSPLDININTALGKFSRTSGFWNNGKETETIQLKLSSGTEIEGTLDHPVLSIDSTTGEVEWRSLQDLNETHYIARDRGEIKFGNDNDLSFFSYSKRENGTFNIPHKLVPDLSYLMGLILGDGYINENYVVITTFDKETVDFLLSSPFGLKFIKDRREEEPGFGGHYRVGNKKFVEFLYQFGFLKEKAPKKQIPNRLFTCSKNNITAFLSGLLDSDGCAPISKNKSARIKFTSTSEKLIKEVILLTQSLGSYGSFYSGISPPTERVRVSSKNYNVEWTANNARILFKEVGFRIKRKQAAEEFCSEWSTQDGIPGASHLLTKTDIILPSKLGKLRSFQSPSYASLKKVEYFINKNEKDSDNIKKLKVLLDLNFYWDSIKSIEKKINLTYDFKVPETESFWANAVVSHNTPRGRNGFYKLWLQGDKGLKQRTGAMPIRIESGVEDDMSDWSAFRKTSYDNPMVAATPEKSKQEIDAARREAILSGKLVKFKQEYLADFEANSDIVFPGFIEEKTEKFEMPNVIDYPWHPDEGPIFAACDHNFAKPSSTLFAQVNRFNDVVIFDELFVPHTTAFNQGQLILNKERELVQAAYLAYNKTKHFNHLSHITRFQEVIADISGNQSMLNGRTAWDDLEQGYGKRPKGLKQDRETGCNMIRLWLQYPLFDAKGNPEMDENNEPKTYPKLFINRNCVNLRYALATAVFKKTKNGSLKEDYEETPEGYEGLLDALRYLLVYLFHDTGQHFTVMKGI